MEKTKQKRLPRGALTHLSKASGLPAGLLSDYANTSKRPGSKRAKRLEFAAKKIGLDMPAVLWLYGTPSKIKSILLQR